MKTVATFHGRVNKFNNPPDISLVTLKNLETGETKDTSAVTEKLLEKGIDHSGCEFEVIIQESPDGKTKAEIRKLEPKTVSTEQIQEIHDKYKHSEDFNI